MARAGLSPADSLGIVVAGLSLLLVVAAWLLSPPSRYSGQPSQSTAWVDLSKVNIASRGSRLSIASIGSLASIASVGSILSIGGLSSSWLYERTVDLTYHVVDMTCLSLQPQHGNLLAAYACSQACAAAAVLHSCLVRQTLHSLMTPWLLHPGSIGGVLSFGSLGAVGSVFCVFSALSFLAFLSSGSVRRVAASGPVKQRRA